MNLPQEMLVLVPVIVAITQIFTSFKVPKRYSPLIAVVLGIAGGFLIGLPVSAGYTVIYGVLCGLSACGLYDVGKTTILKKKVATE